MAELTSQEMIDIMSGKEKNPKTPEGKAFKKSHEKFRKECEKKGHIVDIPHEFPVDPL